jgi:3-oxoacyl-[acyl-carrier protein] reductase
MDSTNAATSGLRSAGGTAVAIPGDVSDPESAVAMIDQTEELLGDDLWNVVANAGITRDNLISRITVEDWDRVIEVNLGGTFHVCKAASRKLLRKKRGSIVTMSSVVGLHGNFGQTNYAASKGGVIALTKALAKEVGSRGIRVNCVAPGYISTELTDVLSEDIRDVLLGQTPLGRLGEPEDIARTVRFLLSDDASFITGTDLAVDGGLGALGAFAEPYPMR